jgi:anti-anti-sigma regulatory factor
MSFVYLRPTGILDAQVGWSLLLKVQSDLSMNLKAFHLDFSEVSSINEQGFDYLVQALRLIHNTQGKLLIISTNETTRSFFESKGLNRLFGNDP